MAHTADNYTLMALCPPFGNFQPVDPDNHNPLHLYRCGVITPIFEAEVWIIAESETMACNQAKCVLGVNMIGPEVNKYIHAHAEQIPCGWQGWGGGVF